MTTVYSQSLKRYVKVEELDTGAKVSRRRTREPELFIKVPLRLMVASRAMSDRARIVLILLLHMAFEAHSPTFPCPNGFLDRYGVNRKTKCLALAELEAAGFISVQRAPRRSPIVTLLKS